MTLRRREFIWNGLLAAGTVALGPGFWRQALAAAPTEPGRGPYGPLGAPDANGIMLPEGFSSRIVARGNAPVGATGYTWHIFSDGSATYVTPDGGWILVSNSEVPADGGGGASAIRFAKDGSIEDAYRILAGTMTNCAGGATPWGTWLSCEEHDEGLVWECDPTGAKPAVARPAMGVFTHEAAAVDPDGRRVYLTEDDGESGFYRFTPTRWPDLSAGLLEIATRADDGLVTWTRLPDPAARSTPTRRQVRGSTRFRRGEGIFFDSGFVYVATTSDDTIWAYDTTLETMERLYDGRQLDDPPLTDVDNITVTKSGDMFVCEDAGDFSMAVITPEREVANFLKLTGPEHGDPGSEAASELTGVTFDPSGTRMYFSSQRAFVVGVIYEITGPFRLERPADRTIPGVRVEARPSVSLGFLLRRGLGVKVLHNEPGRIRAALRVKLGKRTVTLARVTRTRTRSGRVKLRLKPRRKAAARLRRARRRLPRTGRLSVTVADRAGNRQTFTQPVTIRRVR